MGSLAHSGNAYGAATRATGTPRNVEYQVFSQVTGRLAQAMAPEMPFARLAEALHDNLTLWTVVAADVMQDQNGLPQALRARLFYLSEFTITHTRQVLKGSGDAAVLIDINKAIIRGLRGQPVEAEDMSCPA